MSHSDLESQCSRRTVVNTGVKLAYAAPLIAASTPLTARRIAADHISGHAPEACYERFLTMCIRFADLEDLEDSEGNQFFVDDEHCARYCCEPTDGPRPSCVYCEQDANHEACQELIDHGTNPF